MALFLAEPKPVRFESAVSYAGVLGYRDDIEVVDSDVEETGRAKCDNG